MTRRLLFAFCCILGISTFAQTPSARPDWTNQYWPARWILHPTAPARQYGVYHFRKAIELPQKPTRFIVHVSADNRYRLFVNGKAVALGPARSDLQNWNYETLDLAPFLQAGRNVLAAQVWYMGEGAPFAQMSYQLGFLLQGDGDVEKIVNTDATWKIFQNSAYSPIKNDIPKLKTYIVAGDGDRVDAAQYPWGWEQPSYDDKAWVNAKPLGFPTKPRGLGTDGNWGLVPRTIPMMEEGTVRLSTVRRTENGKMDNAFLQGKAPVTVAANTKAVFLLDQEHLTNAYPELTVSRGKDAVVTLSYAEALIDAQGKKGNRNDVDGRTMLGFEDQFVANGDAKRTFRPLWFRTYRYLQLTVETKGEPLVLDDLVGQFTGYPFQQKAQFAANASTASAGTPERDRPGVSIPGDTTLKAIWNVGWRTARLCAGETYYDCPYYEQLQYTGDTRIQAMISLYVTGDDRLMRKAIMDYDHSRFNDGLTQSRYPSADFQVIPTFSLFWVCMIHDYWMHRQDDAFVKSMLPGMLSVLNWHEQRIAKTGLNGPLEWWNFVDWSDWKNAKDEIAGGVPAGARKGGSSILSLQQAYTYMRAGDLLAHYGKNELAEYYRDLARRLNKAVYTQCWDAGRGLFADQPIRQAGTPAKNSFSQHANILAVLTNAVPTDQQAALMQKILTDTSLTQATFYFKFYLFEALKKTGMGDQFMAQLKPWRDMLAMGLTTFAENPEPTRSDCHAWSASPLYEFLSITCGIRPGEPGFRTVRIEPFLGDLKTVEGKMPHPLGDVAVEFQKTPTGGLSGTVTLPATLTGTLRWKGKMVPLKAGRQTVSL